MDTYERYAKIRTLLKQLETERRDLEQQIAKTVKEFGKPVKTNWGQFSAVERKTYVYAPEIAKAIDDKKKEKSQLVDEAMAKIEKKVQRIELEIAEIEVKAKEETTPVINYGLSWKEAV